MSQNLPPDFINQMTLPVIAAPMFLVTGPELVLAACLEGIIGAFPAPNARNIEGLDQWMVRITTELAAARERDPQRKIAPWAANIVVHRTYQRMQAELDMIVKHRPPLVITALGSPAAVIEAVHAYGGLVFADVNSVTFAAKAVKSGADGLILVSAGAGGHTGGVSGFAFVEAVRNFWKGPLVLGGSISSGRSIRAAQVLGADLVYMGTPFIATRESMAPEKYKQMLVDSTVEDLIVTNAFTGVNASMLKPSIRLQGLDPDNLKPKTTIDFDDPQSSMKAWKDVWSAGQGVTQVREILLVSALVQQLRQEYAEAVATEATNPWREQAMQHL